MKILKFGLLLSLSSFGNAKGVNLHDEFDPADTGYFENISPENDKCHDDKSGLSGVKTRKTGERA
jgi:hypothetical protein